MAVGWTVEQELQSAEGRGLDLIFTTPDGGSLDLSHMTHNFDILFGKTANQWKADHPDAAPFPRIRFHDMHATLLLQEGEAVHTVSARLGHANPAITLTIYAHVTLSMQESAESTIGKLLSDTA